MTPDNGFFLLLVFIYKIIKIIKRTIFGTSLYFTDVILLLLELVWNVNLHLKRIPSPKNSWTFSFPRNKQYYEIVDKVMTNNLLKILLMCIEKSSIHLFCLQLVIMTPCIHLTLTRNYVSRCFFFFFPKKFNI